MGTRQGWKLGAGNPEPSIYLAHLSHDPCLSGFTPAGSWKQAWSQDSNLGSLRRHVGILTALLRACPCSFCFVTAFKAKDKHFTKWYFICKGLLKIAILKIPLNLFELLHNYYILNLQNKCQICSYFARFFRKALIALFFFLVRNWESKLLGC